MLYTLGAILGVVLETREGRVKSRKNRPLITSSPVLDWKTRKQDHPVVQLVK